MRPREVLRSLHRWAGGMLGLLLALLGLSGTLLLWKPWWIAAPGARPGLTATAAQADQMAALAEALDARSLVLPSEHFGLATVRLTDEAGAYLSADGTIVARWDSRWDRPELWLFDLHHELLGGETGHRLVGLLGLAGMAFLVTGLILWWPLRRRFAPRLLPRRATRAAVLVHHRDLGALAAPVLAVLFLTGAMLALRPLASALLAPLSARSAVEAWLRTPQPVHPPPPGAHVPRARAALAQARLLFPDAKPRVLVWPGEPGGLLVVRMRQPGEWHANGRTTLWFEAGNDQPVQVRDALRAPRAARWHNALWPLHAGLVGGLPWRLAISSAGLALAMLGLLAMASFWGSGARNGRPGCTTGARLQ